MPCDPWLPGLLYCISLVEWVFDWIHWSCQVLKNKIKHRFLAETTRKKGEVVDTVHFTQYNFQLHLSLDCEGRWSTTDDFTTSFLLFFLSLLCAAPWDLVNSRPVHSLMLSSDIFFCLPCLLPPFTVPCKMILARPDERETCPRHCSLRFLTMVRSSSCSIACLSWHGLPCR